MDELELNEGLTEEQKTKLREKQSALIKLVEAFASLESSEEWQVVKEQVHTPALARIERAMINECLKSPINVDKLYQLQGERTWATRFADVKRFTENLKRELQVIKDKLK